MTFNILSFKVKCQIAFRSIVGMLLITLSDITCRRFFRSKIVTRQLRTRLLSMPPLWHQLSKAPQRDHFVHLLSVHWLFVHLSVHLSHFAFAGDICTLRNTSCRTWCIYIVGIRRMFVTLLIFSHQSRLSTEEEMLSLHSEDHINILRKTENMDTKSMEELSQNYDYLYFHNVSSLLWNCWSEFDETWQEAGSQRPLQNLCFFFWLILQQKSSPGARFTNVRKIRKNISTFKVRKNNFKIRTKCFTNVFVRFDRELLNFVTYENNSVTTHVR